MFFYDAHCHVMNLRHPNLSAVINRYLKESSALQRLKIGGLLLLSCIPGVKDIFLEMTSVDNRVKNLLAIMETPLGDYLLQMEEDLKKRIWGNGITIPGNSIPYDKVFITPLLIDFALRGFESKKKNTIYSVRWKPMADQVSDVCLGIANYFRYKEYKKDDPLFEIHPFMGFNPLIYNLDPQGGDDNTHTLEQVLDKYFADFNDRQTSHQRRQLILGYNWKDFNGDIRTLGRNVFLGVKVYPPTGFNPWPINKKEEEDMRPYQGLEKLDKFYSYCVKKNIPITSHCSNGGFIDNSAFKDFANPSRWRKVLEQEKYAKLRLNLAHLGYNDNDEPSMLGLFKENSWRKEAAELACKYDNVYVDISNRGVVRAYYNELRKLLDSLTDNNHQKLKDKVIFGTDFMINLLRIDSYSTYMKDFISSPLDTQLIDKFCSKNPEQFLYIA